MGTQGIEKTLADETDILVNRIAQQGVDGIIGGFPCQDISFAGGGGRGYKGTPPEMPQPVLDCSGRWCRPFAWLDQNTGSWKTWQRCLIGEWELFSGPWPAAGMMRNGIAYQRPPLAHPTIAPEHTFLPTCAANEGKGSCRGRYRGSQSFRGSKMSEGLRTCETDPMYLAPSFAEVVFGLPSGYTELETGTPLASSEKSQKG